MSNNFNNCTFLVQKYTGWSPWECDVICPDGRRTKRWAESYKTRKSLVKYIKSIYPGAHIQDYNCAGS